MTATAMILNVFCLRQATGTDSQVNQALAGLAPSIPLADLGGVPLVDFVRGLPGVVGAIDSARSDPDNLYITADTAGDLDNSIWPPGHETVDLQAGQSRSPQVTVPVSHEEVRVEREPITDANRGAADSGPAISEEEHEVTLRAERPVVTTEAEAVERVRLGTETVREQETVGGEVRKEQIELDDDARTGGDRRP